MVFLQIIVDRLYHWKLANCKLMALKIFILFSILLSIL